MSVVDVIVALFFLQIKHLVADFYLQTDKMVAGKAIYGNLQGMLHSGYHAVGTFIVLYFFIGWQYALLLAIFDFVTHYHIDWTKMNWGNRDIKNKRFWQHLGLDQFAHYTVYLAITIVAVASQLP